MDKILKMTDFERSLIKWYRINKRDLPWRKTSNPYHIWVSEIILQQTQISQGTNYYLNFLRKFPDIQSLANAPIDEVLKVWQGLGYYSRARNFHEAAKTVVDQYDGIIPSSKSELQKLKGIGPYTAAAIASIAFGEKCIVVDGNVIRLLSRCFAMDVPVDTGKGRKIIEKLASNLLDEAKPGDFNEAMMDLGAMVCKPSNPECNSCPLNSGCKAFHLRQQDGFPVKLSKLTRKSRYFNYLIVTDGCSIRLNKRGKGDIWEGLYDFPLIEANSLMSTKEIKNKLAESWIGAEYKVNIIGDAVHVLTHRNIHARFFWLKAKKAADFPEFFNGSKSINVALKEVNSYPVPKLIENKINDLL
ncbi:A/G-specific DNA-adenine glycosylase [Natronoflexus pectinivorans]|uniref:Adenine DNA glycosylase n=2 Tax=Natronoflexus pectinivorans TaxID=682526 RepID=A0A4R2GNA1_9BACT|nr:A/G-specific DNA-adenine glycosylase [Natronoflexus pectinivorans]